MSIHEILDYCNQRWRAQHGAERPPLTRRGRRVEGRFGAVRLESGFDTVRLTEAPALIVGHIARLHASLSEQVSLDAESATAHGRSSVVDFDRLCRTMHMLNYLGFDPEPENELFLDVDPRHILAVPNDHGAYFADVIHRCGLNPSQVVLTTAIGVWCRSAEASQRLVTGLANYRGRGYRIALRVDERPLAKTSLNFLFRVAPDYVRLGLSEVERSDRTLTGTTHRDLGHLGRVATGLGGQVLLEGIDDAAGLKLAQEAGIHRFQGRYIGRGLNISPIRARARAGERSTNVQAV